MPGYLIDANLPSRFSLWNAPGFDMVANHDDAWTDQQVWEHARTHDQTIVTKDADFLERMLMSSPPPRVVLLKVGNLRIGELREFLIAQWPRIDALSRSHKLLIVRPDMIEAVA